MALVDVALGILLGQALVSDVLGFVGRWLMRLETGWMPCKASSCCGYHCTHVDI